MLQRVVLGKKWQLSIIYSPAYSYSIAGCARGVALLDGGVAGRRPPSTGKVPQFHFGRGVRQEGRSYSPYTTYRIVSVYFIARCYIQPTSHPVLFAQQLDVLVPYCTVLSPAPPWTLPFGEFRDAVIKRDRFIRKARYSATRV